MESHQVVTPRTDTMHVSRFDFMYKDRRVAHVEYPQTSSMNAGQMHIIQEVYGQHLLDTPVPAYPPTMQGLWSFFKSRIFPKRRSNAEELYADLDVPSKTEAVVRRTHGVMWDDYYWLRFEGEEVTWDQVKLRD